MSNKAQGDPVVRGGRLIVKDVHTAAVRAHDRVDSPVVIDVPDRKAAADPCIMKDIP
jgi:hypothetical protein